MTFSIRYRQILDMVLESRKNLRILVRRKIREIKVEVAVRLRFSVSLNMASPASYNSV